MTQITLREKTADYGAVGPSLAVQGSYDLGGAGYRSAACTSRLTHQMLEVLLSFMSASRGRDGGTGCLGQPSVRGLNFMAAAADAVAYPRYTRPDPRKEEANRSYQKVFAPQVLPRSALGS